MRVIQPVISKVEILCSQYPSLTRLYCKPYRQVISNEIELAQITGEDRILNIGCGAIPFTAILMAERTTASVCAIDIDSVAVSQAKRCINRLGLGHRISVQCGNGTTYAQERYSVAVIALQAEPKHAIVRNLLQQSGLGARILVRAPSWQFRNHYDGLPSHPKPRDYIQQNMKTFDKTVLYIR